MLPASPLTLLFFLIPFNALCAAIKPRHDVKTAASPKSIRDEERPTVPSVQPSSTQPVNNGLSSPDPTTPTSPPYIFRLIDLHAIFTSPETVKRVSKAMERTCEAFALYLLDFDLLDQQDLVLRFGDFTLEYHDVAEQLSMLAVKAVVLKLIQMITKGLLGFVEGEMVNAQAGVKMIFALGVLGGGDGDRDVRKRRAGEKGTTESSQ